MEIGFTDGGSLRENAGEAPRDSFRLLGEFRSASRFRLIRKKPDLWAAVENVCSKTPFTEKLEDECFCLFLLCWALRDIVREMLEPPFQTASLFNVVLGDLQMTRPVSSLNYMIWEPGPWVAAIKSGALESLSNSLLITKVIFSNNKLTCQYHRFCLFDSQWFGYSDSAPKPNHIKV